jgi:hypothetical protein
MITTIKPIEIEIQLNETEYLDETGFYNDIDSIDGLILKDLKIELSHLTGYKISFKIPLLTLSNIWIQKDIYDQVMGIIKNNITKNPLVILKQLRGN